MAEAFTLCHLYICTFVQYSTGGVDGTFSAEYAAEPQSINSTARTLHTAVNAYLLGISNGWLTLDEMMQLI